MKSKKFISILLVVVFVFTIFNVVSMLNPTPVKAAFTNFITRDLVTKDRLMDGSQEFKFIAVNCPILHAIDEPVFDVADPFETEDAIKAVAQMGGTVVRDYVISVRKATDTADIAAKKMVANPNTFNEAPFRALDKVLQLCNQYGIRVIIPFTDPYEFFGGIPQYEAFRGKPGQFFTDSQLRQDFKDTINYIVNRTNYYTGVKYLDTDKVYFIVDSGRNKIFEDRIQEYLGELLESTNKQAANRLFREHISRKPCTSGKWRYGSRIILTQQRQLSCKQTE